MLEHLCSVEYSGVGCKGNDWARILSALVTHNVVRSCCSKSLLVWTLHILRNRRWYLAATVTSRNDVLDEIARKAYLEDTCQYWDQHFYRHVSSPKRWRCCRCIWNNSLPAFVPILAFPFTTTSKTTRPKLPGPKYQDDERDNITKRSAEIK